MLISKHLNPKIHSEILQMETYYDNISGRFFKATPEIILRTMYHLNYIFGIEGSVSILLYYEMLGIPPVIGLEHLGWDIEMEFPDNNIWIFHNLVDMYDIVRVYKSLSIIPNPGIPEISFN